MNFEESLKKMEALAEKHFSKYTIQIDKYCDGDWKIEVCYVPKTGYCHRMIYSKMESKTMYHRQLDVNQDQVIEVIEHPPAPGGLGQESDGEGECSFANIGKLDNLYKS